MRIEDFLKLSHVPRWSIVDRTREQAVSDHSYRVAGFTIVLIDYLVELGVKEIDEAKALRLALIHDIYENRTGDIPTTFKAHIKDKIGLTIYRRLFPELPLEKSYEGAIVKLADLMESIAWIERYGVKPRAVKQYLAPLINKQMRLVMELTIEQKQMNLGHHFPAKIKNLIAEAASHD